MISRVCFNPARSRGFLPSELDLTAIVHASRRDIPSCDWHPARRRDHMATFGRQPPRIPRRFDASADALHGPVDRSRRPFRVAVPGSRITGHPRLTTDRSPPRPRFRGLIPLPVGAAPLDFSAGTPSWLSWDSSSLGHSPSSASASTVAAVARLSVRGWVQRLRRCRLPRPGKPGFGTPHDVRPPLRHFRKNPRSGFPSLYSRVSKNLEIGFPLPR